MSVVILSFQTLLNSADDIDRGRRALDANQLRMEAALHFGGPTRARCYYRITMRLPPAYYAPSVTRF
jgi:hypothetical protein